MSMVRVAVEGYGVIGQRLADGVAAQEDMQLQGVVGRSVSLSLRALAERGMPYPLFLADGANAADFESAGIPVAGTEEELLSMTDIVLDATPAGVGAKKKPLYQRHGAKAIFQGGEATDLADVFFHGYANYDQGLGKDFLKLTSCNTTGLIRAVDAIDREVGVERVVITIVRRVADPGDTHRGYVDLLRVEPVPNHQAVDLMTIMPHVQATGLLVHAPVTHGHIISILATPKKSIARSSLLDLLVAHPRIRVVRIADGFNSNTALFRYARDRGSPRGDMMEIAVFEETVAFSGNDILLAINIPQEAVATPETIDGVRAAMRMQEDGMAAVELTNRYLGLAPGR